MTGNTLVVIPTYNEQKTIGRVIDSLKKADFEDIVVVNDGSTDKTKDISTNKDVTVLSHPINIGLGGAISTGIEYAKRRHFKYVLTIDADGQHSAKDAARIAKAIQKDNADIVIGSRIKSLRNTYKLKYIVNLLSNLFTYLLCGTYISDTQSGLRAFNKKAIKMLDLQSSGYEISSEIIIKAVKNNLRIKVLPIKAIYTDYSIKKGQKLSNIINICSKLLFGF